MKIDTRLVAVNQLVANGFTFSKACKKSEISRRFGYNLVKKALLDNKLKTNTQLIAELLRNQIIN